jgi:hypothetical protein
MHCNRRHAQMLNAYATAFAVKVQRRDPALAFLQRRVRAPELPM